jgi:hypothetical protein
MIFSKNKRGVELTMNTIIIAVLVIVVLIVLVLIFSKSVRNFFLGTSDCHAKGGECMSECESGTTNMFSGNPSCETGMICCVKETTLLGTGDENI